VEKITIKEGVDEFVTNLANDENLILPEGAGNGSLFDSPFMIKFVDLEPVTPVSVRLTARFKISPSIIPCVFVCFTCSVFCLCLCLFLLFVLCMFVFFVVCVVFYLFCFVCFCLYYVSPLPSTCLLCMCALCLFCFVFMFVCFCVLCVCV
jgi:hypothetical protein